MREDLKETLDQKDREVCKANKGWQGRQDHKEFRVRKGYKDRQVFSQ